MDEVTRKVLFAIIALLVYFALVIGPWAVIGALILGNNWFAFLVAAAWINIAVCLVGFNS